MALVTTTEMYNFLLGIFQGATYPRIDYDATTRIRSQSASIAPASVELNEQTSNFSDSTTRRDDNRQHSMWTWMANLGFNTEVDFTNIRTTLESIPQLNGHRVLLQRIRYTHPPRQESNNGSKAEFVLNISVHPK